MFAHQEFSMIKPIFVLFGLLLAGQPVPQATPVAAAPAQQTPAEAPPAAAAVPAEFLKMVNPVTPTAASQAFARKMYGYDCAMCHGATGDGKGEMAAGQNMTVKNLTDPATLQGVSDGEIFYVIKNGRGQMLGEGDRLKTAELWNMVILVRSFAKK
jgi:mono/diheme cytochrome c family protein